MDTRMDAASIGKTIALGVPTTTQVTKQQAELDIGNQLANPKPAVQADKEVKYPQELADAIRTPGKTLKIKNPPTGPCQQIRNINGVDVDMYGVAKIETGVQMKDGYTKFNIITFDNGVTAVIQQKQNKKTTGKPMLAMTETGLQAENTLGLKIFDPKGENKYVLNNTFGTRFLGNNADGSESNRLSGHSHFTEIRNPKKMCRQRYQEKWDSRHIFGRQDFDGKTFTRTIARLNEDDL